MTSDEFFEHVQKHFERELPFVTYRKPNESYLNGLFQKDSTLHLIDDYSESGFVLAPFDDTKQTILIPTSQSETIKANFESTNCIETSQIEIKNFDSQKQFHINLVKKAIDKIKNGELQKVVISRAESLSLSYANPLKLFKKLLNTYGTAFVYCWYHPKVGLWIGGTPESLLKIEGQRLSTMSLAGTQKFRGTIDVNWESKEKEEQQIVTDYIVRSLQTSVSNLRISESKTIKAGNVLHLKTDITAHLKLDSLNLKQIIQNLHPTPAVCGLSKEKAKQFILESENYDREYYTGFLGELNFKKKKSRNSNRQNVENNAYASIKTITNLFVNLRCMQLNRNEVTIYVGGGITHDSIPENEWEETVSKSGVIKSIL